MAVRLLAREISDALGYEFSAAFRYQFVLSPKKVTMPEFVHRSIGGRNLYTCPDLPVCEIVTPAGDVIGLLLGYAVDKAGAFLKGKVTLAVSDRKSDAIATFQGFLAGMAGRHVAILHLPGPDPAFRVHVDTASSLGVVYDPTSGLVASSLLLCLDRAIEPDDHFGLPTSVYTCEELRPYLPPRDPALSNGGFNFGHTPDRYVSRLLPNHYLDLQTCQTYRHWPVHEIVPDLEPAEAAHIIVERLRLIQSALFANLEGYFAISGGRDSRVLLACAPEVKTPRMQLYCYASNWMTTFDVKIARAMAKVTGQELVAQIPPDGPKGSFFPRPKRAAKFAQRFAISSGLFGTGDEWWKRGYARNISNGAVWVRGNFLEILTARFWPQRTLGYERSLQHILSRIGIGVSDEADRLRKMDMLDRWVKSIGVPSAQNLHDYSYQEIALGSTQPAFYGFNEQFYIGPASDRVIFETAMRVPPQRRKEAELYNETIRQACEPLAGIPQARQIVFQARKADLSAEALLNERLEAYFASANIPA